MGLVLWGGGGRARALMSHPLGFGSRWPSPSRPPAWGRRQDPSSSFPDVWDRHMSPVPSCGGAAAFQRGPSAPRSQLPPLLGSGSETRFAFPCLSPSPPGLPQCFYEQQREMLRKGTGDQADNCQLRGLIGSFCALHGGGFSAEPTGSGRCF